MKKLLFAILPLMVFLPIFIAPSHAAYAMEEPVDGIVVPLQGFSDYISPMDPTNRNIEYFSAIYGLDSDLVRAVIGGESDWDMQATNHNPNGTTDYGLMQINTCNHAWLSKELGITDFYDIAQNIQAGCYMLGLLARKYDSTHRILMSYNMGEQTAGRLWRHGIYSSRYSREVMERYEAIRISR